MPRKSFLFTPLDATDPVVEGGDALCGRVQSSQVSPTPRKSLFEMDAEDLRAAEQAWLEEVGSYRVPSNCVAQPLRESLEGLSLQQRHATPSSGTGTPPEVADVAVASPCVSSFELRLPESSVSDTVGEQDTIRAYKESEDAAAIPDSEAQPSQLLAARQASNSLVHNSLSLRQRFSIMQAADVSISSSSSATPHLSSMQDIAAPALPTGDMSAETCSGSAHESQDSAAYASAHDCHPVQDARTMDAATEMMLADPSQELSTPAETLHMPRTPWMNVKAVRRPSAALERDTPQLPTHEVPDSIRIGNIGETVLPSQAQKLSSMAVSDPILRLEQEHAEIQQQSSAFTSSPSTAIGLFASAATSCSDDSWAGEEHSSAASGTSARKAESMHAAQLGLAIALSQEPIGSSSTLSRARRYFAPDARLVSSPSITSSLESAAPSAVDRLTCPAYQGRLDVSHGQADASGNRDRAAVPMQQRAVKLLRGRTPEECGVLMYERALAAERQRQARADALRRELDAAADAACTFSPCLNVEKTNRLLWKTLSAPVASPHSQSRTTAHQGHAAVNTAADQVANVPSTSTEPDPDVRFSHQKSFSGVRAGQRLYASGLKSLERQRTNASAYSKMEMESMSAATPRARSLPKAIYGAAALSRIELIHSHAISPHRRKPAYEDTVKECTFQPVTSWRSLSRATTSADNTAEAGLAWASATSEAALSRFLHRASLKPSDADSAGAAHKSSAAVAPLAEAATVEHLAVSPAEQAMQAEERTDFSVARPAALKSKQSGSGSFSRGPLTGLLNGKLGQHGLSRATSAQTATWKLSEQLDFTEFLERQQSHLQMHAQHVERTRLQIGLEVQKALGISPGSRALLKHLKSASVQEKGLHCQRRAPSQPKPAPLVHSWTADQAFRPRITAMARIRRAHTIAELHEGGRSRRERILEQLRAEKLLAEEKQLTLRPSINHYYHTSRPQLRLSNPGPYLAHVQARALKSRESLLRMNAAAKEDELKECTHSPQTTKLPAFIQRLAREFAADPDRHPEHAGDLISPRSEDEGFGHLFTVLQPEWR